MFAYIAEVPSSTRLQSAGFPLHILPVIVPCGTCVGQLGFVWRGIPLGADIFVALGDLQCSVYPHLLLQATAVCNIGTSAQIAFLSPSSISAQPSASSDIQASSSGQLGASIWPYFDAEQRLVVGASLNGGNVIEKFVQMLRAWCQQLGLNVQNADQIYARLNQEEDESQMDTDVEIVPCLFGERHLTAGKAIITVLSSDSLELRHVYRALCRGLAKNLETMMPQEWMRELGVKTLHCVGGAVNRNLALQRCLAQIFHKLQCIFHLETTEASYGAALFTSDVYNSRKL